MKRLKGAMNIYIKQDIVMTFLPLILILIYFYINYATFNKMGEFEFEMKDYIRNVSMMIVFDYSFSFMTRYIMYLNFNSSRKVFLDSIKFIALIKSIVMALLGILIVIGVTTFCEFKGIQYSVKVFGQNYQNITLLQEFVVFISLFTFMFFIFSISILSSCVNKMGYILLIICCIIIDIIYDKIFLKNLENINYYVLIDFVFLVISIVNFKVAWSIFKRKSDTGNCWFMKLCESLNTKSDI